MCEKSLIKTAKFLSTVALLLLSSVSLNAQIQANFIADTTIGCGSLTVNFTNTSSGNITNYLWDFGNGNSSTLQNPTATYSNSGTYNVSLTVSNTGATQSDNITKTNFITVYKLPDADFSFTPNGGCSPITVNFTNSTTVGDAPISSNRWVFADGSQPFFGNNATHTYQTAGNYQPSLEVIDQNGCRDFAVDDTVFVTPSPQAQFSTTNNRISCTAPYTVNFKSNSTGFQLNYYWDFGDGNNSTLENPSHTYSSLGRYDVTLIVSDPNCSDTLFRTEYVILENSVADFSLTNDTLCAGEPFSPLDNSQGASIYSWNFGDGTTINSSQPIHTYQDSGTFIIRLTVSAGAACTDTYFDTVYVDQVNANFSTSSQQSCHLSEEIEFIYTGFNAQQLIWKIGVGDTSFQYSGDTVLHTQKFEEKPGDTAFFDDTLIAVSSLGCVDTLILENNRIIVPLNARISMDGGIFSDDTIDGGCLPATKVFVDSSLGMGTINQWEWVFAHQDTSYLENPPAYTFDTDTIYQIKLSVWNNLGCRGTDSFAFLGGFQQTARASFLQDSVCPNDTIFIVNESFDKSKIDLTEFILQQADNSGIVAREKDFKNISQTDTFYTTIYPAIGYQILNVLVTHNGCQSSAIISDSIYLNGPRSEIIAINPYCDSANNFTPTVQFYGNIMGANRFYWDFGDSSALDSVNRDPRHTYPDTSAYTAILTTYNDSNDCDPFVDTFEVDLKPIVPPTIDPSQTEFCLGDSTLFNYSGSGPYFAQYWVINNDTISNQSSFSYHFKESGNYSIELHTVDQLICTTTVYQNIFVSELTAAFEHEILAGCLPMDILFKDTSTTDTTIASWEWRFGNGDTSYQSIDTTQYLNSGQKDVFLRVENIFGCSDSILKKGYIDVSSINVNFSQSKSVICQGDSVVFRNRSSGNNIDYMWVFGEDTVIDNSTDVTFTFTQADTFDIKLIGIGENGCIVQEVKPSSLIVGAQPQADFVADTLQSNCYPLGVNFTDLSTGNITQWNWRFGDGNSSIFQNPYNEYTSLGTFNVFLKVMNDAGCEDSTLKTNYIQTNGPDADIQLSKDTACINEDITFSLVNQQNVDDFEWDFGDGNTSKNAVASHAFQRTGTVYFTLTLFDSLGFCRIPIRDSVHIFEISADFTVDEDTACQPHRATFTALSPGGSQLTWNFGDGNTSTDPITTHTYLNSGVFTTQLIVNSQLGCKDTAKQDILVHPKPQAESHNDTTICYGDTIELWAKGGEVYHWDNEEFLFDDSSSITLAWPDTSTIFMVEVFNNFNCIDTTYIAVNVQPPPIENPLNFSDSSIIIGEYIDLDATAGDSLNYSWRPKEGLSCTNCPNPRAQPLKNTTYIVSINDPFGCFSFNDTIYIEVIEEYTLDVPNAFSPNGDGNNDIIYAKGWGLKELIAFKIYNRYGELVFESNDFDHGWDGTYKGKPQNMETYVYTVEAETYSGKVLSKKGNISLLR